MANKRVLISATEMVAAEIRDMIYRGEVTPGDRLNPDLLAARLSVSKTPVRDSLHVLQVEGLVEVVPRVGVFVRRMTDREAGDVYRLKEAIEPLAAALAAERGDDATRAELSREIRRLRSAAKRGRVAEAEESVDALHRQLFEMSDSEVLRETFRVVNGRVRLLRSQNMAQPGRLAATVEQHEAVVQAVLAGDADGAARLMRTHLRDAWKSLQSALTTQATEEASA